VTPWQEDFAGVSLPRIAPGTIECIPNVESFDEMLRPKAVAVKFEKLGGRKV
jgi:hypothetical protein